MQQCAGVYLLQNYTTFFGCPSHPSSGVHQTVTAAFGTGHITCQSNGLKEMFAMRMKCKCCDLQVTIAGKLCGTEINYE